MRPTLEYASSSWDPYLAEDVNRLEQMQRQAARFVHNYHDRQPGCITKMVQDLNSKPLSSRRRMKRLTMLYKIQRGLVDTDATQVMRPSDKRTRGTNRLYQLTATSRVISNSFYPHTIQDWNHLFTTVTDAPTLEEFQARLTSDVAASSFH